MYTRNKAGLLTLGLLTVFCIMTVVTACSTAADNTPEQSLSSVPADASAVYAAASADATAASGNGELIVTDMAGEEIALPGRVESVACTWPSGTQLLVSLGMSDVLVAVPEDSKDQPWAVQMQPDLLELPNCSNEESVESLLSLGADIVITTEPNVAAELRSKGVLAMTIRYYSVDEMREAISLLGQILPEEYEDNAADYLSYLDEQIEQVKAALQDKVTDRQTLYYINGNNNKGLYKTAGADTMNEAWAEDAYTTFVTSELLSGTETEVNAEAVLATDPAYVVIGGRYQDVLRDELLASDEWKNIRAVKDGHVLTAPLGVSPFDRFGAEFALMIPWLANQVYPEDFPYDAVSAVKTFYTDFAGYDMTDQEAGYILEGLMPDGSREITG